jgi:hypothetical protein
MIFTPTASAAEAADHDTALLCHLIYSHDPPLPADLVPAAEQAIALATRGAWAAEIELPDGFGFGSRVTVAQVVAALRLEDFIEEAA